MLVVRDDQMGSRRNRSGNHMVIVRVIEDDARDVQGLHHLAKPGVKLNRLVHVATLARQP